MYYLQWRKYEERHAQTSDEYRYWISSLYVVAELKISMKLRDKIRSSFWSPKAKEFAGALLPVRSDDAAETRERCAQAGKSVFWISGFVGIAVSLRGRCWCTTASGIQWTSRCVVQRSTARDTPRRPQVRASARTERSNEGCVRKMCVRMFSYLSNFNKKSLIS